MESELGNYLTKIENDSIEGTIIEARFKRLRYKSSSFSDVKFYFVFKTDSESQWILDEEQSDALNKDLRISMNKRYQGYKKTVMESLGNE